MHYFVKIAQKWCSRFGELYQGVRSLCLITMGVYFDLLITVMSAGFPQYKVTLFAFVISNYTLGEKLRGYANPDFPPNFHHYF